MSYIRLRAGTANARRVVARLGGPWSTAADMVREVERLRRTVPGEPTYVEVMAHGASSPMDTLRFKALPPDVDEGTGGDGDELFSANKIGAMAGNGAIGAGMMLIGQLASKVMEKDENQLDRLTTRCEHLEGMVVSLQERLITATAEAVVGKTLLEWQEKYGGQSDTTRALAELQPVLVALAPALGDRIRGFKASKKPDEPKDEGKPDNGETDKNDPGKRADRLLADFADLAATQPDVLLDRRDQILQAVGILDVAWRAREAKRKRA